MQGISLLNFIPIPIRLYLDKKKSLPTKYIWSMGYSLLSDESPFRKAIYSGYSTYDTNRFLDPSYYIKHILRDGDIVWVAERYVENFAKKVLPRLESHVGLVITDGDESFPSLLKGKEDLERFIEDDRILTIFAQNFNGTYKSNKIYNLPIGLDFHSRNRKNGYFWDNTQLTAQEQEAELEEIISSAPSANQRMERIFVDFHLSDRKIYDGSTRKEIFETIYDPEIMDVAETHMKRKDLWQRKTGFLFTVSPHGTGLDCHRTWEDLLLGCIVIVKSSALDPLYDDLPVVIIKDWTEITKKNMAKWKNEYMSMLDEKQYLEKLTMKWWMTFLRGKTTDALKTRKGPG
jgi:hypothetical protein